MQLPYRKPLQQERFIARLKSGTIVLTFREKLSLQLTSKKGGFKVANSL
jgi:hypothetical protein